MTSVSGVAPRMLMRVDLEVGFYEKFNWLIKDRLYINTLGRKLISQLNHMKAIEMAGEKYFCLSRQTRDLLLPIVEG